MSDAEAYLRLGKKIQSKKFGRAGVAREDGTVTDGSDAAMAASHSVVVVNIDDEHRETRQLPMKKKPTKRQRGDSDSDSGDPVAVRQESHTPVSSSQNENEKGSTANADEGSGEQKGAATPEAPPEAVEELELAKVVSPSSPVPQVEGVAQRISLLSKWFPASLQEGKLEAAVAPGPEFVEATVERINKARDYVLALRYGIEDVETLLEETRDTQGKLWRGTEHNTNGEDDVQDARKRHYWQLSGKSITKLVKVRGVDSFKEALSEFADEVPSTSAEVAAAIRNVVHRRRRLCVPLEYNVRGWHDVLDARGPEAGYVPHLSDVLWLSVASVTAMFSVVTQRLLRGARALEATNNSINFRKASLHDQRAEETASEDGEARPRFFDNTAVDSESANDNAPQKTEACLWLANAPIQFQANLTAEEKSVLAFLRYLMPTSEEEVAAAAEEGAAPTGRISTGLGVWLYASFTTLDTPLDPDTARLAHDLFRTCCRHLRTLGGWKGVRGSMRNALLKEFPSRKKGAKAAYASLNEIAREDVLALYSIVVVLARLFRQNQDLFIPL
ncbi:hypothetical protein ABB37_05051 [Leptomonas pyrrhocoris]|uniref:Uncharacterized protein n=1 Tax=Leptomonas pyrrhocoris TaxID=157538 RepID=A0A0N0DVF3_LEPPY|nr:hypothetical protein ABB37_05051 [Leptomonas pyrrhocoris]KPA80031.1 hypothetical protein ABB37_05051 [Leptomonas pyrrhocoris]|eukprot:XP_015658470.1 hypothetical protein ABB37_05051 [Leptomonas pyrrhocoris]